MNTQKINLKNYFEGREGLYDPKMLTHFLITKKFPVIALEAQLAWLQSRITNWKSRVAKLENVYFQQTMFVEESKNFALFKASLVVLGGLKEEIILDDSIKGLLNSIRKDLALGIIKNFPIIDGEILFAQNTKIQLFLEMPKKDKIEKSWWPSEYLRVFCKSSDERKELRKLFLKHNAILKSVTGLGGQIYFFADATLHHRILCAEFVFKSATTENTLNELMHELKEKFEDKNVSVKLSL